jgi:hypothetical protein
MLAVEVGRLNNSYYRRVIETKNRTLEETAALFDGEDVAQQPIVYSSFTCAAISRKQNQ